MVNPLNETEMKEVKHEKETYYGDNIAVKQNVYVIKDPKKFVCTVQFFARQPIINFQLSTDINGKVYNLLIIFYEL